MHNLIIHNLKPNRNLSKEIGFYLSGLNELREQLREVLSDLKKEELSVRFYEQSNSIGELILHIGEVEWWWFHCTILQKEMTETDKQNVFWDILKKRDFAEKKLSVVECLCVIDQIRQQTTEVLAKFNDTDLEKLFGYETDWSNGKHEASLRWILHHLIDHEAHHKGQIMMIKRIIK